jgi:O-antigen ligase
MLIWQGMAVVALLCGAAAALWFPLAATVLWMAVIECTPELWRSGAHEGIIGAEKAAGILLVLLLALRFGLRSDRYNPAFAFAAMFVIGPIHGLYPGLTLLSSLRSLLGSAGPFLFGFVRTGTSFRQVVARMATIGALLNLLAGIVLNLLHIHPLYDLEDGAFRLGGAGIPAFLGGFALIGVYAGLLEILRAEAPDAGSPWLDFLLLGVNLTLLLLSGARAPLFLAVLLCLITFLMRGRVIVLAAGGALAALVVLFAGQFGFIRAVNLLQQGQAENLSNRNLIWPQFEAGLAASPWVGWGVGAGKMVVPASAGIAQLLGTTAAHNEYLRIGCEGGFFGLALLIVCMALWAWRGSEPLPRAERWFMRLVFLAFGVHSATDNTLIATTSSVLFIWTSAVFSAAASPLEKA